MTGYFIDWDGNTRCVEMPGDGYRCNIIDEGNGVEVLDNDDGVCHTATIFPTLLAIEAAGIVVNQV